MLLTPYVLLRIISPAGFCAKLLWENFTLRFLLGQFGNGRISCLDDLVPGRILCQEDFVPGRILCREIFLPGRILCLEDFVLGGFCPCENFVSGGFFT